MRNISTRYILKRLGMFFLTVWLGITVIFIIPRLAPGDPVQAIIGRMISEGSSLENGEELIAAWRVRFGLDEPVMVQYGKYLVNAATFNTGYSLAFFPSRVEQLIARAMPWTIGLLLVATLLSFMIGTAMGALMAWRKTPDIAKRLLPIPLIFTSLPAFMVGILLLYLFAISLGWFPFARGYARGLAPSITPDFIWSVIKHGTLPAFAIVLVRMGVWALSMRGMMVTTEGEDYMILAEAKGLTPQNIFWRYGIRNSLLPQITALALSIGGIAGGALLVEIIFTYPGIGQLLYTAILNSDYTLIQGIVFYVVVGVALAVLILDFIYPLIDPRITYGDN